MTMTTKEINKEVKELEKLLDSKLKEMEQILKDAEERLGIKMEIISEPMSVEIIGLKEEPA